jgi:hypothetical protein
MDTIGKTSENVNAAAQAGVRRANGGGRRLRRFECGGCGFLGGLDQQPPLICVCAQIPFPHFIEQCEVKRVADARDALAHVQFPAEPP